MNTVHYDIRDFKWVKEENTFYGDGFDLYDADANYRQAFPNGRKQFVIKNYKTGNFQRFTYVKDIYDAKGMYWMFTSEDDYKCIIYIDILTALPK